VCTHRVSRPIDAQNTAPLYLTRDNNIVIATALVPALRQGTIVFGAIPNAAASRSMQNPSDGERELGGSPNWEELKRQESAPFGEIVAMGGEKASYKQP